MKPLVVYSGSVDVEALPPTARLGSGEGFGRGEAVAGVIGGVVGDISPAPPLHVTEFAKWQSNTVQGAIGATLGESFEYHFPSVVTIRKNESAMLPFLENHHRSAKGIDLQDNDGQYPVNAAEITNNTGKTLDGLRRRRVCG
jgi:hypothetical protein